MYKKKGKCYWKNLNSNKKETSINVRWKDINSTTDIQRFVLVPNKKEIFNQFYWDFLQKKINIHGMEIKMLVSYIHNINRNPLDPRSLGAT